MPNPTEGLPLTMPSPPPPDPELAERTETLRLATEESLATLRPLCDLPWTARAGDVEWDCLTTVGHIAGALVSYSTKLVRSAAQRSASFTLGVSHEGPSNALDVLDACSAILVTVLRAASPTSVSWHPFGMAGPRDCAAMGSVEILVHTYDVCQGLGVGWQPPDHLAASALAALFPDVPTGEHPGADLLWATGRIATVDRPRRQGWAWVNTGT
jgi:hypothetical protein